MSAATEGRVHITHPQTGGEALVSDDESVIEHYTALGWVVSDEVPAHLDPDAQDTTPAEEPAGELVGEAGPELVTEDTPGAGSGENTDPASAANEEGVNRG